MKGEEDFELVGVSSLPSLSILASVSSPPARQGACWELDGLPVGDNFCVLWGEEKRPGQMTPASSLLLALSRPVEFQGLELHPFPIRHKTDVSPQVRNTDCHDIPSFSSLTKSPHNPAESATACLWTYQSNIAPRIIAAPENTDSIAIMMSTSSILLPPFCYLVIRLTMYAIFLASDTALLLSCLAFLSSGVFASVWFSITVATLERVSPISVIVLNSPIMRPSCGMPAGHPPADNPRGRWSRPR